MATKVSLEKYVTLDGRWQFLPVRKVNGKPRPDAVMIEGKAVKGTASTFYLEWRAEGKRVQKPCGSSFREALDAWQTQTAVLDATIEQPDEDEPLPINHVSVKSACDAFLAEVKGSKSAETHRAYSGMRHGCRGTLGEQQWGRSPARTSFFSSVSGGIQV